MPQGLVGGTISEVSERKDNRQGNGRRVVLEVRFFRPPERN